MLSDRANVILVCYLVGPGDAYEEQTAQFFESYSRHRPGLSHDLLIVRKEGAIWPSTDASWRNHARHTFITEHSNEGWDIRSLLQVCSDHADYPQVMWFGSNCRILRDAWLAYFYEWSRRTDVGAVGPCGSYEAGISWIAPNPHLRTHCLMVKPRVINSLDFGPMDTRTDCYEFEHGEHSLYNRLREQGLRCLVVGADGRGYGQAEWPHCGIYRQGEQQNLLIADKMTDMYATADADKREELALMAGWAS